MGFCKEIVMNKLLLSFQKVFKEELLKIKHADEKKYKSLEKEVINTMLNEESVISSAKSYVKSQQPKRA